MRRLSPLLRIVLRVGITATALVVPARGPRAQATRIHVDTVLLARDLDHDGHMDFIVRESRRAPPAPLRPFRLAIYLGVQPGKGRPTWTTKWDDEFGSELDVGEPLALDSASTLVPIFEPQADYDATDLLLINARGVTLLLTHGIDYGEGAFALRRENGQVVLDASQDHLLVAGKPVGPELTCPPADWAEVHLVFDRRQRQFTPKAPRCVRRHVRDG